MMRWIGALCVVFATSYVGIEYSKNIQRRIRQLSELKKIFLDLYSDVEYGSCTLLESFQRIAKKQEPLYQNLLTDICAGMEKGNGMPFGIIFSDSIERILAESALRDSDKKGLMQLGRQLGNTQRNGQLRILQIYLQELESLIEELEKTKQEKQKLSRILGVSSGVLIVILLL